MRNCGHTYKRRSNEWHTLQTWSYFSTSSIRVSEQTTKIASQVYMELWIPIISFAKPQCSVSNLIYLPSVVLKYFDSDLSPRHKCQAIFCLFVSHSLSSLCVFRTSWNMVEALLFCCMFGSKLTQHFVYNLANININPNRRYSVICLAWI